MLAVDAYLQIISYVSSSKVSRLSSVLLARSTVIYATFCLDSSLAFHCLTACHLHALSTLFVPSSIFCTLPATQLTPLKHSRHYVLLWHSSMRTRASLLTLVYGCTSSFQSCTPSTTIPFQLSSSELQTTTTLSTWSTCTPTLRRTHIARLTTATSSHR